MPPAAEPFPFPYFYNYPPYFTCVTVMGHRLQPVKETRDKQASLWKELILSYCRHHRLFVLELDACPLFANAALGRALPADARAAFVAELVAEGRAAWLDGAARRRCLVYWRRPEEWAGLIYAWAQAHAWEESVLTLEELTGGDEVAGAEFAGLPRELLLVALKALEAQGKAKIFRGSAADDEGVKFFHA